MHHFFDAITNNKGDALSGYYVRLVDSSGAGVSLYADTSLTPIVSVSGLDDAAKVDADGNVDFYVNVGTYQLDIYATDGSTLVKSILDVGMNIDADTAATAVAAQAAASASATDAANAEAAAAASASSAHTDAAAAQSYLLSLTTLPTNGLGVTAASRTAMSMLPTTAPAILSEGVRRGVFYFLSAADYATITGRTLTADVAIDTTGSVIVPKSTDPTGASGAWVYPYWSMDVPDRLFGATDGTDVKAALEAWGNFIWQVKCKSASCRVSGTTAAMITIGPSSVVSSATRNIYFAPSINATAVMDAVVKMQHTTFGHVHFGGTLDGSAAGSSALTDRNASVGLWLTDTQYMTSSGEIALQNCYHWGLAINDSIAVNGNNSNFPQLPQLRPTRCGISKTAGGTSALSANWTTPTRVGSSGATGQTTTIKVNTVPRVDNVVGLGQLFWINGYPYPVNSTAASGDPTYPYTLTLGAPWLEDAMMTAGSGTGDFTMGGKAGFRGSDTGVIRINGIGGSYCGMSLFDSTAYGVICDRLENNGGEDVWLAFGRGPVSAHYATKIISGYIEGTTCPAQVISLAAQNSERCTIGRVSGADFNFAKWFKHAPRANAGADNNLLYYQAMTEIIRVDGYEGKLIVAQNGCEFSTVWDPPSVSNGTPVTTTISVPAALGSGAPLRARFQNVGGLILTAYPSNTSFATKTTVTLQLANPSTTPVDPASGNAFVTLLQ